MKLNSSTQILTGVILCYEIFSFSYVHAETQSVLFKDTFTRANAITLGTPEIGGLWSEMNENLENYTRPDGQTVSPAFIELKNNTLSNTYQRSIYSSSYLPNRAYAYANLVSPATHPVTLSFTFTPSEYARTHHMVGLANAADGFFKIIDGSGLEVFYPVNGVSLELRRSSNEFNNSQLVFDVFKNGQETSYGANLNIAPFQFQSQTTYTASLTIDDNGLLTGSVSDGVANYTVQKQLLASQIPNSELNRIVINDTQAGSPFLSEDSIRFDNILVVSSVTNHNNFPLYTQVISPYPSIAQTTEWADDVYAAGRGALGSYPCGLTIAKCGCAISSLVMSAQNAGIGTDILGSDVNPAHINAYLESVGGYGSEGELFWLAAQAYFGQFTSEGKIASRFSAVTRPSEGQNVLSFIDSALGASKAVLGYKNGHFLWLPAKTANSYIVRDPWYFDTQTANDIDTGLTVQDYNNSFDSARAVTISATPVVFSGNDIEVYVRGTAELLFTNATGKQVGKSQNGTVLVDLDHASYGDSETISLSGATAAKGKHLLVYGAGNTFTLDVTGTASGQFEMQFFTISATGHITTFNFSGSTLPGITTTYSFNLATGQAVVQPLTYEQFLKILNLQMAGYTPQQKAFFLKWADKIYSNMQEKTVAQTLQSIDVYKKLLIAKKIDSPILLSTLDLLQTTLKK